MGDVMIIFMGGGPFDGKVLSTDTDPDFDYNTARWILRLVLGSLAIAERKERKAHTLLIWRVPSPDISQRAKSEQWSEAKIAALMPYYEYDVMSCQVTDGLVMLNAHFRGVK
jgi:hypothetical protein